MESDCWLWTASKTTNGYGTFKFIANGRRLKTAHVYSWLSHFGEIANGYAVRIRCGTRHCVRPDHLTLSPQGTVLRGASNASFKHGARAAKTHEYRAWCAAKNRCTNPKNADWSKYGGRGITMCERWRNDFSAFLSDMGKCPDGYSLDRRDVDGPYSPDNCRWATASEQNKNRRPFPRNRKAA